MSTDLKQRLQADLRAAMRERDQTRTSTLRMALAAITTEEVAGATARTLADAEILKVVAKEGKKRREAAAAYREAGRDELADQEEAELAILETYLPSRLDEAAVAAVVERVVSETGATSPAQMGQVMKLVQAEVAGRADGAVVAGLVRARLAR